jgi:hypothetical protein
MVLSCDAPAVVLIEVATLCDAEERIVRVVVVGVGEVALVGRDQRQIMPVGEFDQQRLDLLFARHAVALDLDI